MRGWIKNQKGMTMVEILVAILIAAIVIGAMGTVYLTSVCYVRHYGSARQVKMMVDGTLNVLVENITCATEICISDSADPPAGWEVLDTRYFKFEDCSREGQCGVISTERLDELFGTDFFDKGRLLCTLDYENAVNQQSDEPLPEGETGGKNLHITFTFFDAEGTVIYIRDREVDIINLTAWGRDITGTAGSNDGKDLYLYYQKGE